MIIWLFFSVIALLLAYLGTPNNQLVKEYKLFQILLVIWLAWFVSFGGGAMTDHLSYKLLYIELENSNLFSIIELIKGHFGNVTVRRISSYELGYVFLNILFNKLGFNYIGFLFIIAFITNYLLVKFIYRYDFPVFSVLILIGATHFSQQANLVRQMMAASIFLYATIYIENKNFRKYALSLLIASTIHMSAIALIIFYFIIDKKIPLIVLVITWIISIYINYNREPISFISSIDLGYYGKMKLTGRGIEEARISYFKNGLLLLLLLFQNNKEAFNKKYNIVFNFFFIGVLLNNLAVLGFAVYRFSIYFVIFEIIIITKLPGYIATSSLSNTMKSKSLLYSSARILLILHYSRFIAMGIFSDTKVALGAKMYSLMDLFTK
jgi:transmembrane protein EpsG